MIGVIIWKIWLSCLQKKKKNVLLDIKAENQFKHWLKNIIYPIEAYDVGALGSQTFYEIIKWGEWSEQ